MVNVLPYFGCYFDVVVLDPPWPYDDGLSKGKRSAASHYNGMPVEEIERLRIASVSNRSGCVCVLWIPDALDFGKIDGKQILRSWGFTPKQRWVWIKTKKRTPILRSWSTANRQSWLFGTTMNMERHLAFGMGRLARTCHEIAIVGVRGNVYKQLASKRERTVFLAPRTKHSAKPEEVQDALDRMFPTGRKLEVFARRQREGWTCIGNEAPATMGQDVRASLAELERQIHGDALGALMAERQSR